MPRIGERGWVHSGVKVYDNTAAPTSWADLDLSSVVGKNRALAFLKLKNRTAMLVAEYHVRSNGETEEVGYDYGHAGMNSMAAIGSGKIAHFVMETDANGIIEWETVGGNLTDIWVLGYIR